MKHTIFLALAAVAFAAVAGCGGTYYRLEGKTADEWAEGLKSDDFQTRMTSVEKLGAMAEEDPAAVEHLATALDDSVADIRLAALRVLNGIGDRAGAIKPKISEVSKNDPEQHIRKEAESLLAQLGG